MKVLVIGAGPAGLSFATLLAEAKDDAQVRVVDTTLAGHTPGLGITLRDDALSFLGLGRMARLQELQGRAFFYRGEQVVDLPNPQTHLVTLARADLTRVLRERCAEAGVELVFGSDAERLSKPELAGYDLVVGADGASSPLRRRYAHAFAPRLTPGRNRYAWLATPAVFPKLSILLRDEEVPLLAWAYRYAEDRSTFIVECSDDVFSREAFFGSSPEACCGSLAAIFKRELRGKPLLHRGELRWHHFPIVACERLQHGRVVLLGDAAHTTHFSQGFGTMFAFDDACALQAALVNEPDVERALAAYQALQQPKIASFQETSTASMRWAESLVDAAGRRDESAIGELIAARWPNNQVTEAPGPTSHVAAAAERSDADPAAALGAALRGYRLTQMLHVVAKLGVVDVIADQARTAAFIAGAVGAEADALHRLLRALVDVGILTQTPAGEFGLSAAGRLLRRDVEGSYRSAAIMYGEPWWWRAWGGLYDAVRSGTTAFDIVHGEGLFDFLAGDAEAARLFHASMQLMTTAQASALSSRYDFTRTRRLVDVGGGEGALVSAILDAHPHVSAVVLDRPAAIVGARQRLSALVKAGRCELVEGDFFAEVPAGADTYLLKDILHDWDDARAVAILGSVHKAMEMAARLLVVERVLPQDSTPAPVKLIDVSMLVLTGGRERGEAEYRVLLAQAGLIVRSVVPIDGEISVIEAVSGGRELRREPWARKPRRSESTWGILDRVTRSFNHN